MIKYITLENLQHYNALIKENLQQMINDSINNVINGGAISLVDVQSLYPVGSIYISTNSTDPSNIFKFGTWERIEDCFLLAAGSQYAAGTTGGEATHALTEDEIPSHSHKYKRHSLNREDTEPETGQDAYGVSNKTLDERMGTSEVTGGGQPHNNMPPYLAVYVWKRIN